jgi:hypothetical protein
VRDDFLDLSGYDQVGRALGDLVKDGTLVRAGSGLYTKARPSSITGQPVPRKPILSVAFEALRKLGYAVAQSNAAQDYKTGKSTQIPATQAINIGSQRISRNIGFGKMTVSYETTKSRRTKTP